MTTVRVGGPDAPGFVLLLAEYARSVSVSVEGVGVCGEGEPSFVRLACDRAQALGLVALAKRTCWACDKTHHAYVRVEEAIVA